MRSKLYVLTIMVLFCAGCDNSVSPQIKERVLGGAHKKIGYVFTIRTSAVPKVSISDTLNGAGDCYNVQSEINIPLFEKLVTDRDRVEISYDYEDDKTAEFLGCPRTIKSVRIVK